MNNINWIKCLASAEAITKVMECIRQSPLKDYIIHEIVLEDDCEANTPFACVTYRVEIAKDESAPDESHWFDVRIPDSGEMLEVLWADSYNA